MGSIVRPLTPAEMVRAQQQVEDIAMAGIPIPSSTTKDYIFFAAFDGTNNDRKDLTVAGDPQWTNVAQLEMQIHDKNLSNQNIATKYYPGPGTKDSRFGSSVFPTQEIIDTANKAYRDFALQVAEWIKSSEFSVSGKVSVAVTGFSRGCATAVVFLQKLSKEGVVDQTTGKVLIPPGIGGFGQVKVPAIALLDPVITNVELNLEIPQITASISNILVVRAEDEFRTYFKAADFSVNPLVLVNTLPLFGNHCDIGGCYDDQGLGALSLQGLTQFFRNIFKNTDLDIGDIPANRKFNAAEFPSIHAEPTSNIFPESGSRGFRARQSIDGKGDYNFDYDFSVPESDIYLGWSNDSSVAFNDIINQINQNNVAFALKSDGDPQNPEDFFALLAQKNTTLTKVNVNTKEELSAQEQIDFDAQVAIKQIDFSPIGFLDFEVQNLLIGSSTTVNLFLPSGTTANTYYIYGAEPSNANPHWYEFLFDNTTGTGAQFIDADNDGQAEKIALYFVDGGRGDSDGKANGVITDPGAPGIAQAVKLTKTAKNIFVTEGKSGIANLLVTLNQSDASFINEIGLFAVDDEQGKINGINPNKSDYLKTALGKAQVIFSSLPGNSLGGNNLNRQLSLPAGQHLMFYMVQNGTTDSILSGQTDENIFFSLGTANSDGFDHLQVVDIGNGEYKLAWEEEKGGGDKDFNDMVFTVKLTNPPSNTSFGFQGKRELIDLTDKSIDTLVSTELAVNSEAAFNNFAGFYIVNDAQGTIIDKLTGQAITPNQVGYAKAAISQKVAGFDRNGVSSVDLKGGVLLAPFIIANSDPDAFLIQNPNNQDGNRPLAYFAYLGANPDKVDHVRQLGNNTFGFEDLFGGGDRDFNDLVVKVNLI